MSCELFSKAWDSKLKEDALLVLLVVYDNAIDDGLLSISLINASKKVSISVSELKDILATFEMVNLLTNLSLSNQGSLVESTNRIEYKINHLDISSEDYEAAYQSIQRLKN